MPDAIDNLVQDLNQSNTVDEFPGYPGYKLGDLVPGMAGVRIGDTGFYGTDAYGQQAPYNWRTGVFEFAAPPTTPANPDSQFENYIAGIKDLQAPVSRPASPPKQPYIPTFTPMAAPPAVRVSPPTTPANPDSQFENDLAEIKYSQAPVSSPSKPYTPTNPPTASLSNPSTLGGGSEIDYNVRDQPVERINIGNTDEKDAFVRTGIGTTLDPKTEEQYGVKGLVSPYQAGGTVGVEYLDPSQVAAITEGQKPSVPQGVVTRGETVKIPGPGLPNYEVIGKFDNGDVIYADPKNTRDSFIVPGVKDYPGVVDLSNLPEVVSNVGGGGFRTRNRELSTPIVPFQETAASVGAVEPTTTSEGGFNNTGGNVAVGPGNVTAGPGVDDTIRFNPDYKPKPEVKPGDEFKDSPWEVFVPPVINPDYINPVTGKEFPPDQDGNRWNFTKGDWDYADPTKVIPPVKDTTKPPVVTPPGGGTTTTPPGGGTGTTPTPGGGGIPSGGGQPGRGPTIIPPREPVTPLVRRETVIHTKGTKEVPLPDRQADPFAKLYADLLANAQQQEDRYRYINYDPDQIMNAAMSGFRRRGAMRSLQGY